MAQNRELCSVGAYDEQCGPCLDGFDAPAGELNAFFGEIDRDGSGEIDFKELHHHLRQGASVDIADPLLNQPIEGEEPNSPESTLKGGFGSTMERTYAMDVTITRRGRGAGY